MVEKQNCVVWIQTASLYTQKHMIYIKTLQKMLKPELILQIMNQIGRYPKEKLKKQLD